MEVDPDEERSSIMKLALDIPGLAGQQESQGIGGGAVATVDLTSSIKAIDLFRQSNTNALLYEQKWHQGGVSQISDWLRRGFPVENHPSSNAAVTGLVRDMLSETTNNISLEIKEESRQSSRPETAGAARESIEEALKVWAMRAHSELRDELDEAFASRSWAKLAWWKLLWRVDDVAMIMSELLERRWLADAEKRLIWLSGRSIEAGYDLAPGPPHLSSDSSASTDGRTNPQSTNAWPSTISAARQGLQASTVPSLQALSQSLLFQTISISSLTAALSGLIYIALPTASIYSVGAVGALGVVWSLRHLQKRWERARERWESDLRESARIVLRDVEEEFRATLQQKPEAAEDTMTQSRNRALLAVEHARQKLDMIEAGH